MSTDSWAERLRPARLKKLALGLAIDANPGFVAIHHVARIIFVLLSVPVLTAWVARRRARG